MIEINTVHDDWVHGSNYAINIEGSTDNGATFNIVIEGVPYFADEINAVMFNNPSDVERAMLETIQAIMRG